MGNNLLCCQPSENAQIKINHMNAEERIIKNQMYLSKQHSNTVVTKSGTPKTRNTNIYAQNTSKLMIIQKRIKGMLSRIKFIQKMNTKSNTIKSELKNAIVPDFMEVIAKHQGEILSKSIESKYGKFILPENSDKQKYIIKLSKPVFIHKGINKDIYIGSLDYNKSFKGYGVLYKEDGIKFEGIWENSKLHGIGRYFTNDGGYYIGTFFEGSANGKGVFCRKNNSIYNGYWLNDMPEGEGEESFPDGSRFKGYYKNGQKVSGKFQWEDGSYYEGELENDKFQGRGLYFWSEGRSYTGEWYEGKMSGQGLFTYLDGSYYEGEFHNGQRNGFGKYVWNENKNYEGGWMKGKQHGKGRYTKNGKVIEGVWINGKLTTVNQLPFSQYQFQMNNSNFDYNLSEYTGTYTVDNINNNIDTMWEKTNNTN